MKNGQHLSRTTPADLSGGDQHKEAAMTKTFETDDQKAMWDFNHLIDLNTFLCPGFKTQLDDDEEPPETAPDICFEHTQSAIRRYVLDLVRAQLECAVHLLSRVETVSANAGSYQDYAAHVATLREQGWEPPTYAWFVYARANAILLMDAPSSGTPPKSLEAVAADIVHLVSQRFKQAA